MTPKTKTISISKHVCDETYGQARRTILMLGELSWIFTWQPLKQSGTQDFNHLQYQIAFARNLQPRCVVTFFFGIQSYLLRFRCFFRYVVGIQMPNLRWLFWRLSKCLRGEGQMVHTLQRLGNGLIQTWIIKQPTSEGWQWQEKGSHGQVEHSFLGRWISTWATQRWILRSNHLGVTANGIDSIFTVYFLNFCKLKSKHI